MIFLTIKMVDKAVQGQEAGRDFFSVIKSLLLLGRPASRLQKKADGPPVAVPCPLYITRLCKVQPSRHGRDSLRPAITSDSPAVHPHTTSVGASLVCRMPGRTENKCVPFFPDLLLIGHGEEPLIFWVRIRTGAETAS